MLNIDAEEVYLFKRTTESEPLYLAVSTSQAPKDTPTNILVITPQPDEKMSMENEKFDFSNKTIPFHSIVHN